MDTNDFSTISIRDKIKQGKAGETFLEHIYSKFSCPINPDVGRFLCKQSIDFTKRNQSVTYLIIDKVTDELVAYFTIAIKPINVNASKFSNNMRRKIERVSEVNEQTGEYLLSAYLIAQLSKNFADSMNERITGDHLLRLAIEKVKQLQDMAGGTVVFLEADNEPKLIEFYERNGFKRFATRKSRGTEDQHKLVQLLKVI